MNEHDRVLDPKIKGQILVATWGFLLTGMIGTGLTYLFNRLDREAKLEFEQKKTLSLTRQEEVKRIINLCQRRYFYSQRLHQLMEARRGDEIEEAYKIYKQTLDEWNLNLHVNRLLVEKIISKSAADKFCDVGVLEGKLGGSSVHTKFVLSSLELRKGYLASQANKPFENQAKALEQLQEAAKSLQALYTELMSVY
jgi:hypothetical protein